MTKRLTPMQWKTLAMLHKGWGQPKGAAPRRSGRWWVLDTFAST